MNAHRLFAGLATALGIVGHNVPGPVGWVCLAIAGGILAAVDRSKLGPQKESTEDAAP